MTRLASKVTRAAPARLAGAADGQEIEAEEHGGGDAVQIAPQARRIDLQALADDRRPACHAGRNGPEHGRAGHLLAQAEPGDENHEEGSRGGKEGGVGHRRVEDRQVPEEEVAREGEAGSGARAVIEAPRGPDGARASSIAHPRVEDRGARATRQNALANGPTSPAEKRTKTGERPMATAPAQRARKAVEKPAPEGAVVEAEVGVADMGDVSRCLGPAGRGRIIRRVAGGRLGSG